MPAWNPQANDIFLNALDIAAPAGRKAFIERACGGDAELRAQVESLIVASQKAGSFLENPPSAVAHESEATRALAYWQATKWSFCPAPSLAVIKCISLPAMI